ncbi:hypothetical protein SNEBB_009703 [Seison nebaliae]|nr:hypothetical protein SNEBB_009703 [Seison nebaliae]
MINYNQTFDYLEQHFKGTIDRLTIDALGLIVKHLFLGPDDVEENEIIGIIVQGDQPPELLLGPNFKIFPTLFQDLIAYFIPIGLMYIDVDTVKHDSKFHVLNKTIIEYMDSLKIHPFHERFTEFSEKLEQYLAEMINSYDFPKVVGISEPEGYCFASELSYNVNKKLDEIFKKFYTEAISYEKKTKWKFFKNHSRTLNRANFSQIFKENWNDVISVTCYRQKLPDKFWNRKEPDKQELFHGFVKSEKRVYYLPYAFEIIVDLNERKLKPMRRSRKHLPKNLHLWRHHRIDELVNRSRQFRETSLSNHTLVLIEKEIRDVVSLLIDQESLATVDNYYRYQKSVIGEKKRYRQFINYEITPNDGHAIVIIRSMSKQRWYVINNEKINEVENLRLFFERRHYSLSYNSYLNTIFWYKETSYLKDINNLKQMVKPILNRYYGTKRNNIRQA